MSAVCMKRNGFTKEFGFPFEYRYGKAWWADILLMAYLYLTPGVSCAFLKNQGRRVSRADPGPAYFMRRSGTGVWSGVFYAPISSVTSGERIRGA